MTPRKLPFGKFLRRNSSFAGRAILSSVFEISVGYFHFSEGSQAHRQPFLCFSNAAENLHHGFKTTAFTAQSSPEDGFLRHLAEAGQSPTKVLRYGRKN